MKFLNSKYAFWVILLIGLSVRVLALIFLSAFPLTSDALSYHEMGVKIALNEGFTPFFPPGLPYYLSLWYAVFGISEIVGRTSMIFLYVAVVVVLYLLVLRLSNRRSANLAVLAISLFPSFVLQSVETRWMLPTTLCLLMIVYLSVLITERFTKLVIWFALPTLGLTFGWAILIRPSNLLLSLAISLYLFFRTKKLMTLVLPLVLAGMMLSAWLYKAQNMTGRFVAINDANVFNVFLGNNPYTPLYKTWWFGSHGKGDADVPREYSEMYDTIKSKSPTERDASFRKIALEHVVSRPDLFFLRTVNRMCAYFALDTFTGSTLRTAYSFSTIASLLTILVDALFYIAFVGLSLFFFLAFQNSGLTKDQVGLTLAVLVLYSLPYWLSMSHPIYHFPIIPILAVWASMTGDSLLRLGKRSFSTILDQSKRKRYALLACLILFCLIQIEWVLLNLSRI